MKNNIKAIYQTIPIGRPSRTVGKMDVRLFLPTGHPYRMDILIDRVSSLR
ncbi:hypothetical protein [Cecembia lonarensis]|nr:hypothetical protein [Cecembia lonarensis]